MQHKAELSLPMAPRQFRSGARIRETYPLDIAVLWRSGNETVTAAQHPWAPSPSSESTSTGGKKIAIASLCGATKAAVSNQRSR